MKKHFIVGIIFLGLLAACGTTSKVKPATSQTPSADFSKYQRVIVLDFVDAASQNKKGYKKEKHAETMKKVVRDFADMIAAKLREKTGFVEITRNTSVTYPDTLVIGGQITKYEGGDAALRWLVGFGAGSSKFDATVQFLDGSTDQLVGVVNVDKNSWALGGAIAGSQTADKFMEGAAKKIAAQFETSHPKSQLQATPTTEPAQGSALTAPQSTNPQSPPDQQGAQTSPPQTGTQSIPQGSATPTAVPPPPQPTDQQTKY